jgi:hypothetical protein
MEIKFPIDIGDTLNSFIPEEDGIIGVHPWKVAGLAQIGNKQYAIGPDNEMHEIGTLLAMIPEGKANSDESRAAVLYRKITKGLSDISYEALQSDEKPLYKLGQYDIINKVYDLLDDIKKGE